MLRAVRLKFLILFVLTVLAIVFVLPSLTGSLPPWWEKHVSRGLKLGLDLKGGMHLILQVDMEQAVDNTLTRDSSDLKDLAEKRGITLKVGDVSKQALPVTLINQDEQAAFQKLMKDEFPQLGISEPQRQDNSLNFSLGIKPEEISRLKERTISQTLEVLRNRIDQFGVTEPVLVREGSENIVVQLPGIQDPQRALDLIGKTAQLQFKLVDDKANLNLQDLIDHALKEGKLKPGYAWKDLNQALAGKIPAEDEVYIEKRVNPDSGRVERIPLLMEKKVLITGADIKDASSRPDPQTGQFAVYFEWNSRGAREFSQITEANLHRHLAIILDDVVQSAPEIQSRIGARGQITGSFTPQEAHDLAIVLRAGALPATVKIVQNITVGPTLGADSIRKGLTSGLFATLLVIAFMIFYYRFSGLVADYALVINVIFLLGMLSLFGATLTLPGIAGIILSIGMAVDSNVLIYERMREEFHAGKPLKAGIDGGYDKAFWTIIDAHVTTLITAVVLFLFGTGPIKGFAVTLSVGVILNLFTALFGTRVVYDWLLVKRWLKNLSFFEFFKQPNIDFIGWRRYAFVFSGVLCLVGLIGFVQLSRGHGNLGVEFSGGTLVQMSAAQPFTVNEVRDILNKEGWGHAEIQPVEHSTQLIIKLKKSQATVGEISEHLAGILNKALPANHFKVIGKSEIGASVSQDLRNKAIVAIALSMLGIVIYIAWRFEFIFGIGALVATFHDVLAVLGVFWLLDREITLLVVTALLTLAGYSLTDTVVVFDRIRENLARKRGKLGEIINLSVNEVLSRTIITSSTVFLVVLALFLFGGVVLRDFALAMILGVLVGTYSSVFVASPVVFAFRKEARRVVVKREKVIELAAQKQKREEKKAAKPAASNKKKGGKK
jgi:SecD/SecF fusion protein